MNEYKKLLEMCRNCKAESDWKKVSRYHMEVYNKLSEIENHVISCYVVERYKR